jgi:chromosomal replication initiator protein
VTEVTFHIWLAPLEPAALVGDTLFVRAPEHIRTWVEERFAALIRRAASTVGAATSIEIVGDGWEAPEEAGELGHAARDHIQASGLNPRYTFDQFVICDGNRLGHAAGLAVAEMPSQAYNPLFIHGRPGLGKTHLLHAIGNYVQAYGGGLTVRYATVEEFTAEFVRAVRGGDPNRFRDSFRGVDVLLIDDIQFLAEKMKTEEEFFHTFNSLYEGGSQLVITSDRKPRDMAGLETRLRERFEHGLVCELEPPDFDARMAILRKRSRLDALHDVADETLAEIAAHVNTSVRTLEGALIRVVAYGSLRGEPITPELARQVLERLYPRPVAQDCSVEEIQRVAADHFGVSCEELLAHDRRPHVVYARQVAMFLARELTDATLPAIGKGFGGRNHSTVLHAHRRISEELGRESSAAKAVDALRARLTDPSDDRA